MHKMYHALDEKLTGSQKHRYFINHFKKLQTNQERIRFMLNAMHEYDIIPNALGEQKSAIKADKLREEGNKVLITNDINGSKCLEALKLYTKSLAYAPCSSEQLIKAYVNRSVVLFKMQKYLECINDIDRVLCSEYPNNMKGKLYVRKLECLAFLGKPLCSEMYSEAQCWLDRMSLNDEGMLKWKRKLDKAYNKSGVNVQDMSKESSSGLQNITIESENPEVPCASNSIAIRYNEHWGRHVVAARNIQPGEIIAVEKPYTFMLILEKLYTHCSYCLNVSWKNIPCNYCIYAMYCSEQCKANDWKRYHDIECAIFPALIELECTLLNLFSVRLVIQGIREAESLQGLKHETEEVDKCNDPRIKGFASDGKLYSNKYRSLYSLVTNTEKREVYDLLRSSLNACTILYYLITQTAILGDKLNPDLLKLAENDNVTYVGGLILRNQQIIPSNAHSFSEEYNLNHIERGIALMPFFSLTNHSCNPNVGRQSRFDKIVMYAIYPIQKDEQILDSYGQHYAVNPIFFRQHELMKQYYFHCDCLPCKEEWPLYSELKSYQVSIKNDKDKSMIETVLKKLSLYVDLVRDGDILDKAYIMKDLQSMIDVLYVYAPMNCVEMCTIVETLKRIFDLNGNRFIIPKI